MACKICGREPCSVEVCSPECCLVLWEKTKPKKKSTAARIAKLVGLRSIGEVRFAANLRERNIGYEYEPEKFKYVPTIRSYCPDFRIKKRKRNGGYFYIEYKGNLRGSDRTTLKLIKKQYPTLDLRLIFEKPLNKLNKKSKTTYAAWAEQYGFPWAEKVLPPEWARE